MLKKSMDKAYIKSTGEILDVKSKYATCQVNLMLPNDPKFIKILEDSGILVNYKTTIEVNPDKVSMETVPESWCDKFELSDGKTYDSKDLVVGIDNIRNIHLNKILK